MAPIVRRGSPCRAECPINRPNYTGCRGHPLKWGRGGLVDPQRRGSMAFVRVGGVGIPSATRDTLSLLEGPEWILSLNSDRWCATRRAAVRWARCSRSPPPRRWPACWSPAAAEAAATHPRHRPPRRPPRPRARAGTGTRVGPDRRPAHGADPVGLRRRSPRGLQPPQRDPPVGRVGHAGAEHARWTRRRRRMRSGWWPMIRSRMRRWWEAVDFTGVSWAQRDEAFGYVPVEGDEVMTGPAHGAQGVDGLVNTVYHRAGMLAFEPVDVGIGWSPLFATNVSMPLVIDMTRPGTDAIRGMGQSAQSSIGGVALWPLDGSRDVPVQLGLETPNPVPTQDVSTLGTPVSITVAESRTITSMSFVVTNTSDGTVLATRILTNQNDPNFLVPESFIAAIPLGVLAPNTTYVVVFSGSAIERSTGIAQMIDRTWSFTTAAQ